MTTMRNYLSRQEIGKWVGGVAVALLLVLVSGCGDLFQVKNPGQLEDKDLNTEDGLDAVVEGVHYDLSQAYDIMAFDIARLTDEMAGSGSYSDTELLRRGVLERDDSGGEWNTSQQARFVAEDAIRRIQDIVGEDFGNRVDDAARVYLHAGIANRMLGEDFCQVVFDGGSAQPKSAAFERARGHFDDAIQFGQQSGQPDVVTTATAGKAQVQAWLGNWGDAASLADQVPTDHRFETTNDNENLFNEVYDETHSRHEMSAHMALAGSFSPPDARAPYTDCTAEDAPCPNEVGADGLTPHLRQEKYQGYDANYPAVKGTEMRLLEAEAALRAGDPETAVQEMNEARAYYEIDPMDPDTISSSSTSFDSNDQAWSILDDERHLTLWLEGRRLWDLHRWDHPFLDGGTVIYPGIDRRASCYPIPEDECDTNPNVDCG